MAREFIEAESLNEVLDDLERRGISGAQRSRAVNGYISLKARYSDIPVSGVFELTPLCNLDCKMCYVHLTANQIGGSEKLLSVQNWQEIMRQAVDAGMMYATLTGGECLTYPGFREIYLYLASMGIQTDILTNGRLLTEDMVAFFAQYPPGVIQVSVYGSDEDAYEQVTGHRAFHEVMQGIERAKAAGLNVTLAITPNRYMQKDVQALLDLVHAQGLYYVIGDSTLKARNETDRVFSEYVVEIERYMALKRMEHEYLFRSEVSQPASFVPRYVPKNRHPLRGLPCGGAHNCFHVNWKGMLCPCTGYSELIHCNIRSIGFEKAWEHIREEMTAYSPPVECATCSFQSVCTTCPAEKGGAELHGTLNTEVCRRIQLILGEQELENINGCPAEN